VIVQIFIMVKLSWAVITLDDLHVTLVTIQGRGSNFGFSGIVQRQ